MKKKISQISPFKNLTSPKSDIYRRYRLQINKLISSSDIRPGSEEEKQLYVPDEDTESKLQDIYDDESDSLSLLIGYAGIGKSTVLRNFFNFSNSAISESREQNAIIFPMSCNGKILDDKEIVEDFTIRISSVCSFLEKKFPALAAWFNSSNGQHSFFDYINDTNPKILEHVPYNRSIGSSPSELESLKLSYAYERERFTFMVTKLKYYLGRIDCRYHKLIVILDDIEPLPYHAQKSLIMQYVRFYECMRNVSETNSEKKYIINMLISIRPHTNRILNSENDFKAYYVTREIIKEDMVDLHQLFSKKILYYSKEITIENKESWDTATKVLLILSGKFNGKYRNLIKNISLLNSRDALKFYSLILSNRIWIQKNADKTAEFTINENDYIFNNITVLRALACEQYYVYAMRGQYLVPNILLNTPDKNYAILNLCLLNCFLKEDYRNCSYGREYKTGDEIIEFFLDVFPDYPDLKEDVQKMIEYFYREKLLRKSINDTEKTEVSDEDTEINMQSKLYLSPKGYEISNMLSCDSVYFELCREEYYRTMESEYSAQSSYELMQKGQQLAIFCDLLILLKELIAEEQKYLLYAKDKNTLGLYHLYFGSEILCEKLYQGLCRSIEYSGNIYNPDTSLLKGEVEHLLAVSDQILNAVFA